MDYAIKSAIAELPKYIVARIIHKELLVSTIGAFPPLQVVICSDFHLRMSDILPLNLNSSATANSIDKWTAPSHPP